MKEFIKRNPKVFKISIVFMLICTIFAICMELFIPNITTSNPWWFRHALVAGTIIFSTLMLICLLGMAGIDD